MGNSKGDRIVVLIDMDCFFCQVETKLRPEHAGKPLAVVQYNQWQLGGIIAVNYEAREYGVTRHMRGEEAKEKCPDIVLASVPCLRGKSDTSRYRSAGREVVEVLKKHCNVIERASVDEAYLDITDVVEKRMSMNPVVTENLIADLSNTFVVGYSEIGKNDEEERSKGMKIWISNIFEELEDLQCQKLAIGGTIVEEIRADIFEKTGYRCSAGIARNKILAKLACGLHKPNRQTILPANAIPSLYSTLPIKKVRNLGGKFGDVVVESLNCNVMSDLLQYSLQYLQERFDEKTGLWLHNIARGIDNEPVTIRLLSKSIGACKKFPGKQAIASLDVLKHWVSELAAEVCERLEQDMEENERRATQLVISYHYYQKRNTVTQSRSCILNSYNSEKMTTRCVDIIIKATQCPIAFLGISAGKFVAAKGCDNFMNFFKPNKSEGIKINDVLDDNTINNDGIVTDDTKINENNYMFNNELQNMRSSENIPKMKEEDTVKYATSIVPLNEKIPDMTESKSSPTTRRVNNLISFLNKKNKENVLHKSESYHYNINESLDQDKFKGSFFMNILNKAEYQPGHVTCAVKANALGSGEYNVEDNVQRSKTSDNNDQIMKRKLHTDDREDSHIQKCDITFEATDSDNKSNLHTEQHISKKPSTSYESIENNSTNAKGNENNEMNMQQTCSTRLHELFPDLNNIDPNVVSLLPLDLQNEAKLYMKTLKKNTINTSKSVMKSSKQKDSKSKINNAKRKKTSSISNFLIKGNSYNTPLKRCIQCDHLIPIEKYVEHSDFHMAENLQREFN